MRPGKFSYSVRMNVTLSIDEVKTLIRCSTGHYDVKCQKLSQPGGLLHRLHEMLKATQNKTVQESLDFGSLDLLAKITETGRAPDEKAAHADLVALLGIIRRETLRVNDAEETLDDA